MLLLGMLALPGASLPAHAQNLVVDGDFELSAPGAPDNSLVDYAAGRSFDGGYWFVTQGQAGIDTGDNFVYGGNKSLFLNDDFTSLGVGIDAVSQTLNTVAGQAYTISFYANASGPNSFSVIFGGVPVSGAPTFIAANGFPAVGGAGVNAGSFQRYTATAYATCDTTTLTFLGVGSAPGAPPRTGQTIELDNVSVAAVPEASPLLLFGVTLGIGVCLSPFRKKASR